MSNRGHIPVMSDAAIHWLRLQRDGVYIDGTFGAGGHTSAILESAPCRVFAIDRDPRAIAKGAYLQEKYPSRLTLIRGRFSQMRQLLAEHGIVKAHGVLLDLGVSSMQLAGGGFSFRQDAPLDMRMDDGAESGRDAAGIVNLSSERELARILYDYGEERMSRAIARAIVDRRHKEPIKSSVELANVVRSVLGKRVRGGIDPATRSFQAIRIAVNDELGELRQGLLEAEHILIAQGRLAVISFHSLEDRIVKKFFSPPASPARDDPASKMTRSPSWASLHRGCLRPDDQEVRVNPRSRSARMRVAARIMTPNGSPPNGSPPNESPPNGLPPNESPPNGLQGVTPCP